LPQVKGGMKDLEITIKKWLRPMWEAASPRANRLRGKIMSLAENTMGRDNARLKKTA
jgi:hypothetical protein